MLVVQHNCGQGYESRVMALETALSVEAGIVLVQKLFIGNREICYSGFNFYWPSGERKETRVMTAVRKDLGDKIIVATGPILFITHILCCWKSASLICNQKSLEGKRE